MCRLRGQWCCNLDEQLHYRSDPQRIEKAIARTSKLCMDNDDDRRRHFKARWPQETAKKEQEWERQGERTEEKKQTEL